MSAVLKGNYVYVQPGQKAFKVASNYTNYIELGVRGLTPYYFEGRIENDEFVINATLLDQHGRTVCEIVNNFPQGEGCRKKMTPYGYVIADGQGNHLIEIRVEENICFLKGTVYGAGGEVIARDHNHDFLVYRGPLVLGKSGTSLGIVVR